MDDRSEASRLDGLLWLTSAFLAGAVIMALEMLAFRLYAPYFGYSIYVWGNMISVVLLALALGYALGGAGADLSRDDGPLFGLILGSGIYLTLVSLFLHPLLEVLAGFGDLFGSVLATLIVFAPPMTGLASISPFVIRLQARQERVGRTAGTVYAVSTLGSICGIAATTFGLIPSLGSRATLSVACGIVLVLATIGLARRRRLAVLGGATIVLLPLASRPALEPDTVWIDESPYNQVQVRSRDGFVGLVLNRGDLIQSAIRKDGGFTYQVFDQWALGPLLVPARRVLVLGMGAGASIAALRGTAPSAEVTAVELDPAVVEAGRRFFGLEPGAPGLEVHVADARRWLRHDASASYDLVQLDVYQGGPTMPFYLTTVEFFALLRERMRPEALLMMNVVDPGRDRILLSAVAATLEKVFAGLVVLSNAQGNHLVFASTKRRDAAWIRTRLREAEVPETLVPLVESAIAAVVDLQPPPGAQVLRDDHAPVEALTRRARARSPE